MSLTQLGTYPVTGGQERVKVVGQPHGELEWENPHKKGDRSDNRIRCVTDRLGSSPDAHELSETFGSNLCSSNIHETEDRSYSPTDARQHIGSCVHQQPWRYCLLRSGESSQKSVAVVPGEEHIHHSSTLTRSIAVIFQRIEQLLGPIEVDLFASRITRQCPAYYS